MRAQPDERSRIAMQILRKREATHCPARGEARFVRCQPTATVLVFEQGEMRCDLAIEL